MKKCVIAQFVAAPGQGRPFVHALQERLIHRCVEGCPEAVGLECGGDQIEMTVHEKMRRKIGIGVDKAFWTWTMRDPFH